MEKAKREILLLKKSAKHCVNQVIVVNTNNDKSCWLKAFFKKIALFLIVHMCVYVQVFTGE